MTRLTQALPLLMAVALLPKGSKAFAPSAERNYLLCPASSTVMNSFYRDSWAPQRDEYQNRRDGPFGSDHNLLGNDPNRSFPRGYVDPNRAHSRGFDAYGSHLRSGREFLDRMNGPYTNSVAESNGINYYVDPQRYETNPMRPGRAHQDQDRLTSPYANSVATGTRFSNNDHRINFPPRNRFDNREANLSGREYVDQWNGPPSDRRGNWNSNNYNVGPGRAYSPSNSEANWNSNNYHVDPQRHFADERYPMRQGRALQDQDRLTSPYANSVATGTRFSNNDHHINFPPRNRFDNSEANLSGREYVDQWNGPPPESRGNWNTNNFNAGPGRRTYSPSNSEANWNTNNYNVGRQRFFGGETHPMRSGRADQDQDRLTSPYANSVATGTGYSNSVGNRGGNLSGRAYSNSEPNWNTNSYNVGTNYQTGNRGTNLSGRAYVDRLNGPSSNINGASWSTNNYNVSPDNYGANFNSQGVKGSRVSGQARTEFIETEASKWAGGKKQADYPKRSVNDETNPARSYPDQSNGPSSNQGANLYSRDEKQPRTRGERLEESTARTKAMIVSEPQDRRDGQRTSTSTSLVELLQSGDAFTVKEVLRDVDDLLSFTTVDQIDPEPVVFGTIQAQMNHSGDFQVQLEGFKILGWAAKNYPALRASIVEMGAIEIILRSMDMSRSPDDLPLHQASCRALLYLTTANHDNTLVLISLSGLPIITRLMNTYISDPELQMFACGVLNNVCDSERNHSVFVEANGLQALSDAIKCHPNRSRLKDVAYEAMGKVSDAGNRYETIALLCE